jgi:hypothetical protein
MTSNIWASEVWLQRDAHDPLYDAQGDIIASLAKESFVGVQELAVVVAASVSHVLVIIAGVAILVLSKGLWMLGRKR